MEFRKLLVELNILKANHLDKGFTSASAARYLKKQIKEVSNDFRRLHQMGFLRRKRVKRRCLSKTGKYCYKGYEYIYTFSVQGRSYLEWMRVQKPIEDFTCIILNKEILGHLPQELKNRLLTQAILRSSYRYKGPSRRLRLFDNEAVPIAITLLENQKLKNENFDLYKEKLRLSEKNIGLEDEVCNLKELNKLARNAIKIATERIDLYEREKSENVKDFLSLIKQSRENSLSKRAIIDINRKTQNRLIAALYFSLPEEKFDKVMDQVIKLGEDELAKVDQNLKTLNAEK